MGKRRDSFIEEAGNLGKKRWIHVPKNQLLLVHQGTKCFKGAFRGLQAGVLCAKQQGQLRHSSWNWSCGGLISVILIVLNSVNLPFPGFPGGLGSTDSTMWETEL